MTEAAAVAAPVVPSAPAEAATPPAETPVPPVPEAPKGPDAKELRRMVLQEQLDKTRAERANKKQTSDVDSRTKELERRAAELDARENRVKGVLKDPIATLKDLGIRPEQLYQALTDHLIENDTPEKKQRQVLDALKQEIDGKYSKEVEDLRKQLGENQTRLEQMQRIEEQRAQRAFAMEKQSREREMLSSLKSYEDLQVYYDEGQLIAAAYEVAEALEKAGLPYDYESVGKKMNEIHNGWQSGVEKKKAAKNPPAPTTPAEAPKTKETPSAIGNATVATTAAPPGKRLGVEGRSKMIENFLRPDKK